MKNFVFIILLSIALTSCGIKKPLTMPDKSYDITQ